MRIAFVAHTVCQYAGPAKVTAAFIERLCEDHQVSVFSHSIRGIDLSKIRYHWVPMVKRPKFLAVITFLFFSTVMLRLFLLLHRRSIDIVHSMEYDCPFCANVVTSHFCEQEALRLERSRIIEIPYKTKEDKLKYLQHSIYRRLAAFLEGLTLRRHGRKKIIAVSQRLKDDLVRHYGDCARNTIVIPNGVDLEMFNPTNQALYRDSVRQEYGISDNDLVLLFAGGDWERKGACYAIEALSLLKRADVKLFIVGPGDEKFYGQFADLKHVSQKVVFVSHSADLRKYFAACDIFVLPTIYEPFGLVIIEAMACGMPVITSKSAGAGDIITDRADGLLLNDPTDTNELAAAVELLLTNNRLRETMGNRARKTAQQYSWDQIVHQTVKVYNGVRKRERGVSIEHA